MKRKLTGLFLIGIMATMLVGCGTENTTTPQADSNDTDITAGAEPTEIPEESSAEEQEEPEPTEQPTDTDTPTEEVEPTEEAESETDAVGESTEDVTEPTEEVPEQTYTYTDLDQTMYAKQTVNVRDLPSTDGEKLGSLKGAQEVKVTGQCNETSWYRIEYDGGVGYVSNNYIVTEKPVTEVSSPSNSSTVSRNIADYRSISSLDELSAGAGWDTDFAGFVANHKSIEKVAYTHNGITVLLYDYQWDNTIIFYDFTSPSIPWSRYNKSDTDQAIEAGGIVTYTSDWEEYITPISNFQIY